MSVIFRDCEYRFEEKNKLYCKNKTDKGQCDNCKHSYDKRICILFDELIDELCTCWMWCNR